MTTRMFWRVAAIAILSTACRPTGTRSPGGKDSPLRLPQPFPPQTRLDAIKATPEPNAPDATKLAGLETWKLRGPLPTTSGATPASSTEATALAQILGPSRPVTEQTSCFAREIAGFLSTHDDDPPPELITWIAARCGVGHTGANLLLANRGSTGARLIDAERDRDTILGAAGAIEGPADFGIGLVDDGKAASLVIAYVARRTAFENVAMLPENGRVVVAGEVIESFDWLRASVTRGQDGVARCAPLAATSTSPRAFKLSCPVDPADASATIEVAVGPTGALVGEVELTLFASPNGSLGDTWTARDVDVPVANGEADTLGWLTAINAVRERNGLAAWTLAKAQSEDVAALAPHLFDATDRRTRDEVALGMLAGWKVEGSIRNAGLGFLLVPADVPLGRALGSAMARPTFRELMMSEDRAVGAIGIRKLEGRAWNRFVLVGYDLFTPRDYRAEEERFLDQLDADRAARGLPPVERVGGPKDRKRMDEMADRVRNGESEPMEELEGLLDHFAESTGQTVRGAVFTTLTLDGFRAPFEGPLAAATGVVAIVKIADWRPPGAAWGQHVIYVVYAVPGDRG